MRYIITTHYDNGNAYASLVTEKAPTVTNNEYDQYCDELEDNESARDWASDNLCCDYWDTLDKIAEQLEDGKTVNISLYI